MAAIFVALAIEFARERTPLQRDLILALTADEEGGVVSPDGRWIIFRSSENGEREVFVDSFPEPKRRLQVSQGRSLELSWGDSGRSIVFLQGSKVSRVPFDPQAGRVAGPSRVVYESPAILAVQADPTTERVLVARRAPGSEKPPVLRVVLPAG
mgnify:CR=1 FL=1